METGDGLLARVRPRAARLSLAQAAALAEAATACGNGAIGLSARGNLHLRGVSESSLVDLHARLRSARLIDADPEIERLRNIVSSPLDDLDSQAAFKIAPAVTALEELLAADAELRRLPAKFSFLLDALGRAPLADVEADIRFEAATEGTFAVFVAGEDALAAECRPQETGDVAARVCGAFLRLADDLAPRRMRNLVARLGARAVFAEAGVEARARTRGLRRANLADVLGAHVYGTVAVVGAAAAFGEIDAIRFAALIERAQTSGATGLRLTPWRAFLIAGLDPSCAAPFVEAVVELDFIVNPDEPILHVAACPGAPACMHGRRPVRGDATRFSALLPGGDEILLHVSGCAKGCARPAATAATLIATDAGYDLVLAGRAGDPPVLRRLSNAKVEEILAREGARIFAGEGPPA
jgi:precorrin-3B synthase